MLIRKPLLTRGQGVWSRWLCSAAGTPLAALLLQQQPRQPAPAAPLLPVAPQLAPASSHMAWPCCGSCGCTHLARRGLSKQGEEIGHRSRSGHTQTKSRRLNAFEIHTGLQSRNISFQGAAPATKNIVIIH